MNPIMNMKPVQTVAAAATSPGCWQGFCTGVSKVGQGIWTGMQKVAHWAVAFFKAAAFHIGIGLATAIAYVKAHSAAFAIGGASLGAGVLLGLLFNRCCGCCNKSENMPIG